MKDYLTNYIQSQPFDINDLRAGLKKERAERYLPEFIKQAWHVIEPSTDYVDNWHIHLMGEYLQAVNDGQIRRLLINIPPRHMKSICVTVCYPVWTWTRQPAKRFIKLSYSDTLSRKHNILARDIISSPWYRRNWGDVFELKEDVNRQNEFKNNHQGMMYSSSVGGAVTGEGGDVLIVDDPQNPKMANSEAEREAVIAFFKNTMQSRLNDPKTGVFIIIMQRLHENDLTGHILAKDLGYEHLCLPAEAEEKTVIHFPISGKELIRKEGDLLNPERFGKETLDELKQSMGSVQYAGQYQQTPAPAEGAIFKREWLQSFYKTAPVTQDAQSWDMAFKKSEGSAKVAGCVGGRRGSQIYVKDMVNDKMSFTESLTAVRTLSGKWPKARAIVIEDKANGPAIMDALGKEIPGIVPFSPQGSKEERAMSVTPYFEAGNILLPDPKKNPWVDDLIRDLLMFPKGRYKDTVDALVQLILYLMDRPSVTGPPATQSTLTKTSYWRGR